ncbi:hypothetical protein [Enterococcus wangshanyuanii]|uniref:Bacteriocin n=1 Tax=Enterococcus wangshanyuanii TaxID=2005703 RepID=A0ABQ1PIK5_9ENTE|nr:hypothetical protein [Enterococcus wangshanyuanii]GGC97811.1 hypothetical protein GCM10011573_29170 [Enterococcus wangshanyuanii]
MKEVLLIASILLMALLPKIFGVISSKGYNAVQKKMDMQTQKKENEEHMNNNEDN